MCRFDTPLLLPSMMYQGKRTFQIIVLKAGVPNPAKYALKVQFVECQRDNFIRRFHLNLVALFNNSKQKYEMIPGLLS